MLMQLALKEAILAALDHRHCEKYYGQSSTRLQNQLVKMCSAVLWELLVLAVWHCEFKRTVPCLHLKMLLLLLLSYGYCTKIREGGFQKGLCVIKLQTALCCGLRMYPVHLGNACSWALLLASIQEPLAAKWRWCTGPLLSDNCHLSLPAAPSLCTWLVRWGDCINDDEQADRKWQLIVVS